MGHSIEPKNFLHGRSRDLRHHDMSRQAIRLSEGLQVMRPLLSRIPRLVYQSVEAFHCLWQLEPVTQFVSYGRRVKVPNVELIASIRIFGRLDEPEGFR